MKITPEISAALELRYAKLALAHDKEITLDPDIWIYLQESEELLKQFMNTDNPPGPNAKGSIEVSWGLYFLNNEAPALIKDILVDMGMPETTISSADWATWEQVWEGQGKVYGDGSLFNISPYAVFDGGWTLALLDYFLLTLNVIVRHPFGDDPATVTIDNAKPSLRIALFGDWGTGNYIDGNSEHSPSQQIAEQIKKLQPDISIHLGDVYYAGTASEEENKFVNVFPTAPLGNFTLNSNHEMYDGANGYFATALASEIFSKQNETSYFQIEYGDWLIIGLDTAYDDPSRLFMDGAINDSGQVSFLRAAAATGKQIVLLTHHNPVSYDGSTYLGLWNQVMGGLLQDNQTIYPKYWYWGHQHNGIVYQDKYHGVLCRCLGNGAIPIGNATWLYNNPNVLAYTNKALTKPTTDQALRVMNGFAILDFTPTGVTETWYYQDGTQMNF